MRRAPDFEQLEDDRWQPQLVEVALQTRLMLERVWDEDTAYQGVTLAPEDVQSRGQCGVSSLWLARYLDRHGANALFVEGTLQLDDVPRKQVWVEARRARMAAQIIDIASDQYQVSNGTRVHVGMYGQYYDLIGIYDSEEAFHPHDVPRQKLLARYALLEEKIAKLPARHRMPE